MAEGAFEPLEHAIAMPLDVGLICSADLLSQSFAIEVAGIGGRLVLPRLSETVRSNGTPLMDPPAGFERIRHTMLPNENWGAFTAGTSPNGQVEIAVLKFEFKLDPSGLEVAPEELPSFNFGGTDPLIDQTRDWLRRLMRWSQVLTNQPTDVSDPSPLLASRHSDGAFHWVRHLGYESLITTSTTLDVVGMVPPHQPPDALCERLVDEPTFARLVALANDPNAQAPTSVIFLAEARLAGLRHRHRLAMTLGPLISDARVTSKMQLPSDLQAAVVRPRNDAVHRGIDPTRATVTRAAEILDGLVRTHHPDFACDPALRRAHRPMNMGTITLVAPEGPSVPPA